MHCWHVTPEYINARWTEEQFLLLFRMRNKRMKWEQGAAEQGDKKIQNDMSDDAFFAACNVVPTTVN
jgi:hypothetical protein